MKEKVVARNVQLFYKKENSLKYGIIKLKCLTVHFIVMSSSHWVEDVELHLQ